MAASRHRLREIAHAAVRGKRTRMPRASSVAEVVGAMAATMRAARHLDARRGGAAGDEQQRVPAAPICLSAGQSCQRCSMQQIASAWKPCRPQLDDHAVGMRLRLGDDPGVGNVTTPSADVSRRANRRTRAP
jgi:hypothetical protein